MYNIKLTDEQIVNIGIALTLLKNQSDEPLAVELANTSAIMLRQWREQLPAVQAFETAVRAGILSNDKDAKNYVGDYMYMGKMPDGSIAFKHIMDRGYVFLR